jgi:hypothetical protein
MHIHSVEIEREKPQTENKQEDKDVPPGYNALHFILKKYRVVMPIKEMTEQSPCCIKFLQELLKTDVDLSEEELVSLTSEFHNMYEVPLKLGLMVEGASLYPFM